MLIAQAGLEDISYGMMFVKTIIAMIVIIILAFLTIKYVLPKFMQMRRKSDSKIQVLDFQPLEQRKTVYLLKILDKKVAVAVTDHSCAKLCEWDAKET